MRSRCGSCKTYLDPCENSLVGKLSSRSFHPRNRFARPPPFRSRQGSRHSSKQLIIPTMVLRADFEIPLNAISIDRSVHVFKSSKSSKNPYVLYDSNGTIYIYIVYGVSVLRDSRLQSPQHPPWLKKKLYDPFS